MSAVMKYRGCFSILEINDAYRFAFAPFVVRARCMHLSGIQEEEYRDRRRRKRKEKENNKKKKKNERIGTKATDRGVERQKRRDEAEKSK